MLWYNKRGEALALNVIIKIVLGLVFLGLFFAIILALKDDLLSAETWQQGGCMLTNTVKCQGGIFSDMPSLCSLETIEDPIDTTKLADITRDSYWMYKKGTCDFGNAVDEVYPVYAFAPKNDISLDAFFNDLVKKSRGKEVSIEYSDYAYLEQNTKGQTICIDAQAKGVNDKKLSKNEIYYLLYYDDQELFDGESYGDRIIITSDPSFDLASSTQLLKETALVTTTGVLAGTAVIMAPITAGFSIVVGAAVTAAATEAIIISVSPEENYQGCVLYGPVATLSE